MTALKIVIIGGGSYAWSPQLIRDLFNTPTLQGSTLVLHDIDPEPLEVVFALARKMLEAHDTGWRLHRTTRLAEALPGADLVLLTITTGGLEAMRADIEIPEQYGVYHSVGDTVGPGGLSRALRNIPVVVDIARQMNQLCPNAWLINYTNPMTTLCRAVTRETAIKTIGLCHEFVGVRRAILAVLDVANPDDLVARVGGINHLIWITDLKLKGEDVLARVGAALAPTAGPRPGAAPHVEFASLEDRHRVKHRLFEIFGALPAAGDRHVAEFFPFFLSEATGRGGQYGILRTSIAERYEWRATEKAYVQALLSGQADLQAFLADHSGEAAALIAAALAGGAPYTGVMNLPNRGQISNLPLDTIVETFGTVDASGARGLPFGDLPPAVYTIINRHVANQETVVEAALKGDRRLALQVLVNDPLMVNLDGVEEMLDEMLAANRPYLPLFFD